MSKLAGLLPGLSRTPVVLDRDACLRVSHRLADCHACMDLCPGGALAFDAGEVRVDEERCTACGLCAGACPTAALRVRGIDERAVIASSVVHCQKVQGEGMAVPCLGWLRLDHLLEMQLRHSTVNLASSDCSACSWSQGGRKAAEAVSLAGQTLAAVGRPDVLVWPKATELPGERRSGCSLGVPERVKPARARSPWAELVRPSRPGRLTGRMLAHRRRWVRLVDPESVSRDARMPAGPWRSVTVGKGCNGCGKCAESCPTGAMQAEKRADHWHLSHQPAACVACGTCQSHCAAGAIREQAAFARPVISCETQRVMTLVLRMCQTCGREYWGRVGEDECLDCESLRYVLHV